MNIISISNFEASKRLKSCDQIYKRNDKQMSPFRTKEAPQQATAVNVYKLQIPKVIYRSNPMKIVINGNRNYTDLQMQSHRKHNITFLLNHASSCAQSIQKQCIVGKCKEAKIVLEHLSKCSKDWQCSFLPCVELRHYWSQTNNKSNNILIPKEEITEQTSQQSIQSIGFQHMHQSSNIDKRMFLVAEDWRSCLTVNSRMRRISQIIRTIFPNFNKSSPDNWKMVKLHEHISRIEVDIYKMAKSLQEYENLLDARIKKILKDERKARLQQQRNLIEKLNSSEHYNSVSCDIKDSLKFNSHTPFLSTNSSNVSSIMTGTATTGSYCFNHSSTSFSSPDIRDTNFEINDTNSSKSKTTIKSETLKYSSGNNSIQATPVPKRAVKSKLSHSRRIQKSSPKKKVFSTEELKQALNPTLERLWTQEPESLPFRQPVDPVLLQIPDYFDIVKIPMDLSTIKRKLNEGEYLNPMQYVEDVWLMFENAWLYNKKSSRVYRYCSKLAEIFEQQIDPVMQTLGYCCGRKYVFQPQALCCYGKELCTIPIYAKYMNYQNRITYCLKCFLDIPGDSVTIGETSTPNGTTTGAQVIPKNQFAEGKNDNFEVEPFVNCKECGRKSHQICVLHLDTIWPEGFVCDHCFKVKNQKRKENKFSAKRLPQNKLGDFIEQRVNNYLRDKESDAGEVHIRVVSSSDKLAEVKKLMREEYVDTGDWPATFPYRAKTILAFEEINGYDVCFFAMCVQEYGTNNESPNARRVQISYLDSVNLFTPKQFRTDVYYEILLGYFDFVKMLGFMTVHIWACPPPEGSDYIFHRHPSDQKIPTQKRLLLWYKKLFQRGINNGIVVDYNDILQYSVEENIKLATQLPYYEGDFWPNAIEESISELQKQQLSPTTTTKEQWDALLTEKIYSTMEQHKDVFFVLRLHTSDSMSKLPPIIDTDSLINCDLMDGCSAFLTMAHEKNYEFSSLRRATFSTMALLCELHNNGNEGFTYTCNTCRRFIVTQRFHCTECNDFDLCVNCYNEKGHCHRMEKLALKVGRVGNMNATEVTNEAVTLKTPGDGDGNSCASNSGIKPSGDSNVLTMQQRVDLLVHACMCRDANCRYRYCYKMKKLLGHTKICQKSSICDICKKLNNLSSYHAKNCRDELCAVNNCNLLKSKMKQQQLRHRQHLNQRYVTAIQNYQRSPRSESILCKSPVAVRHKPEQTVNGKPIVFLSPQSQQSLLVQKPKLKISYQQ